MRCSLALVSGIVILGACSKEGPSSTPSPSTPKKAGTPQELFELQRTAGLTHDLDLAWSLLSQKVLIEALNTVEALLKKVKADRGAAANAREVLKLDSDPADCATAKDLAFLLMRGEMKDPDFNHRLKESKFIETREEGGVTLNVYEGPVRNEATGKFETVRKTRVVVFEDGGWKLGRVRK